MVVTSSPVGCDCTVEIDLSAFDEPRQVMWDRLVAEHGQETVAELVTATLTRDLTAQGMQLVTAI